MSSLWLTSVFLFLVVTMVASWPFEEKDEEKKEASVEKKEASVEKRSGYDCYIGGRRYLDGEVFSYPGFSRCIRYRCNNGGYSVVQGACERNRRCVPEGSVVREKCRSLRCVKQRTGNVNYYRMEPTSVDMCEIEGKCVRKHVPFEHSNCARYRCVSTPNGGYNFVPTGTRGCEGENGRCHRAGSTFSKTIDGYRYRNCVCRGNGGYQCRG